LDQISPIQDDSPTQPSPSATPGITFSTSQLRTSRVRIAGPLHETRPGTNFHGRQRSTPGPAAFSSWPPTPGAHAGALTVRPPPPPHSGEAQLTWFVRGFPDFWPAHAMYV